MSFGGRCVAEDKVMRGLVIPASVVQWALPIFRTVVMGSCVLAWSMWLDIRDLKRAPVAAPALTLRDWEYERRLLLIDHEQLKTDLRRLEMRLEEVTQ
jgi:hypothetical protein